MLITINYSKISPTLQNLQNSVELGMAFTNKSVFKSWMPLVVIALSACISSGDTQEPNENRF